LLDEGSPHERETTGLPCARSLALVPPVRERRTRRPPVISVAIIGPDGAGKSTVTELLEHEELPAPVKRIYMGVNLESSSLMLPTTRLALTLKAARGRRPDMVGPGANAGPPPGGSPARRVVRAGGRGIRVVLWVAEEWYRQLVAEYHRRRGAIIVFDRHFYADYFHVDQGAGRRSLSARVHGWLLRHAYPKPDLVICLDAPGQVLFDRKGEASPEWLEQRRRQYLQLATVLPDFVVVDVDRPVAVVAREVATVISEYFEKRRA
jgi:thymidylate kinase